MFMGLCACAQVTPNIGFDNGNFAGWECLAGSVKNGLVLTTTTPLSGRHTIIDRDSQKGELDPYGQFPVYSPNGSKYGIRLGNELTGSEAERVSYTFTVPNTDDYSIIFDYAVVLQNPKHPQKEQPRFTATVYNVTDNVYLDCPSFNFIAGPGLPGFILMDQPKGSEDIYYKPWSKATIDLHGYPGKTMRIEFTTMDCVGGGHFGYAYLDIENSDINTPITGNAYCGDQQSVTLNGPEGFASYTWYNADRSKILGNDRSLTLSPAPPDNTPYVLHIEPYEGLGCADDLNTVVNKINADFKLNINDQITCPDVPVDLTSPAITNGSVAVKYISYFTDDKGLDEVSNPTAVKPGLYYIKGMSQQGCSDFKPLNITTTAGATLTVTDPPAVSYPASVDLSATYSPQAGYQYMYLTNAQSTSAITEYAHIIKSGTYYIKAIGPNGCSITKPVKVTVYPPPGIISTTPNTFTPNGDGVNDYFQFSATGYYDFVSLKIYNRNGTLVFLSKSADTVWNGNYNGKRLPAGVYYWIFNGSDGYTKKTVTRSGSITLIR